MFNIISNHQENANQNHSKILPPHIYQYAKTKKADHKHQWECGATGTHTLMVGM